MKNLNKKGLARVSFPRKNSGGFTLIELLVVIAVIGVLSGVVLQSLNSARTKSRNTARLENANAIAKAFQVATTAANNNQFPSSAEAWACLGKTTPCWNDNVAINPNITNINNILRSGLAGGSVPVDPFFINRIGDTFTFHSSMNPDGGQGLGAYISWEMEGPNGFQCGRGFNWTFANVSDAPNYRCMLHLGPPTLNP